MKKLFVYLSLFITSSILLFSAENYKTITAVKGSQLNIPLSQDEMKSAGLTYHIYTFTYESQLPKASEIKASWDSKNNKAQSTYTIPNDAVFIVIKRKSGDKYLPEITDVIVSDKTNIPVEGANMKAGLAYLGTLPENIGREANFEIALEYFNKELELYAGNIQAMIGLISLQYDLKLISKNDFENRLDEALKNPYNSEDENDVRAVSRALKALSRMDDAETIEKAFAGKHSNASLAEELYISNLAKASTRAEFTDGVLSFIKTYPRSSNRERIFSALVSAFLQAPSYEEVKKILVGMEDVPSSAYTQLAYELAENAKTLPKKTDEERLKEARYIMDLALIEAEKPKMNLKPDNYTDSEWKTKRELNKGVVFESYGNILKIAKDYAEAINFYLQAKAILKDDMSALLYEAFTESYFESRDYPKAFNYASEAVINSKSTTKINELLPDLYKKVNGSKGSYDQYMDSLLVKAKELRINRLKKEMLNDEVNFSQIATLNGISINLNLLKGKVIILDFWSSWCGPCADELSSLQTLNGLYGGNNDIIIAAVNVWEKEEDREKTVTEYIKKGEFDLPFYLDKSDLLPKKLGIMGLPTRIFVGKDGKVKFKKTGFTNEEDFIRDASDIIELLMNE